MIMCVRFVSAVFPQHKIAF